MMTVLGKGVGTFLQMGCVYVAVSISLNIASACGFVQIEVKSMGV